MGLKGAPGHQMIVDKICMHWYNTTSMENYCHDLPSTREPDNGPGHFKSRILADATEFGTYGTYVSTPIGIIWALFIGAWVDRYGKARKMIMVVYCVAGIVENLIVIYLSISWNTSIYYNILHSLPTLLLVGGTTGPSIAAIHYITSTTPPKLLAIRFMIFQTCLTFGAPIGNALGGFILVQKPVFHTGEIRNYTMVYLIALSFEVVALLWIIFMVNNRLAQKQQKKIQQKLQDINGTKVKQNIKQAPEICKDIHPIKMLFDLENLKAMIRTLIKKRPNKGRKQVFLLIFSLALMQGESSGLDNIATQFVQKVYLWRPDWTSYMKSITMFVTAGSTMVIVPFLIKTFNVADIKQALFGYCLIFFTNILKGSWLSENAYYLAMAIGAFGGTAKICSNSHVAKIVDRDEMGKIMSFVSALETLTPMLFTTVFAYIFKYTIDSYPGAVFQVIATLILIPIVGLMWIDLFTERPLIEKHLDHIDEILDDQGKQIGTTDISSVDLNGLKMNELDHNEVRKFVTKL